MAPTIALAIPREGDRLFKQIIGQTENAELYSESEEEYFLKVADVQISFGVNSAGTATQLVLRSAGQSTVAKRIE